MICDPIWVEGFFLIFIFIFIFFIFFNGFFELLHFAWKFHDVYQGMVTVEISWKTDRRESYFYHKVDSKTLNQGSHDSELLVRNSGINGAAIKWPRAPLLLRVNKLVNFLLIIFSVELVNMERFLGFSWWPCVFEFLVNLDVWYVVNLMFEWCWKWLHYNSVYCTIFKLLRGTCCSEPS